MSVKNFDPRPKKLQEVDIPFRIDIQKLHNLAIPTTEMLISELLWHFDYPFWDKIGTDDWNLTPWEVIKNPKLHPNHFNKIKEADLSYPIEIVDHNNRWLILDGLHRLAKAYIENHQTISVRKVDSLTLTQIKL
jgi:hypothetical protein